MGSLGSLWPVLAAADGDGFFNTLAQSWEDGGFGMYPIAACGIFVVAIAVDRFIMLFGKASIDKEAFLRGLKKHVYAGDLDKAISYVAGQKRTPLTAVVKAGLINVPKGAEEVQAAMDEAMLREGPKLEKRTAYLAMFSNAAMLFGLLGTIYGLIQVFGGVGAANPADKAAMLSQGISHVMNCTGFGLIVAIMALLSYAFLQGRTQNMLDDINETSVGLLNLVVANKDKMKIPANIENLDA